MVLNEPETSLHPDLLAPLARLIGQASRATQIVVVSHAAPLINALQREPQSATVELVKDFGETQVAGSRARSTARPGLGQPLTPRPSHRVSHREVGDRRAMPTMTTTAIALGAGAALLLAGCSDTPPQADPTPSRTAGSNLGQPRSRATRCPPEASRCTSTPWSSPPRSTTRTGR